MPLAKIPVLEGRYDERRLSHVSKAVQDALISVRKIPSDDRMTWCHPALRVPGENFSCVRDWRNARSSHRQPEGSTRPNGLCSPIVRSW